MKRKSRSRARRPVTGHIGEAGRRPTDASAADLETARPTSARAAGRSFVVRPWPLILAGLFLITRLPGLTMPGLQYDEATYLYWGQAISIDWGQRYIGAGWGGKQPLHAWLAALFEKLLSDPVFAGRLVSVVSGALALVAIWLLAERLFSRRAAVLAAVLYILCPFTLLYDRLAMIDSLLTAEAVWIIYLGTRLIDRQEIVTVAGLGLAFGLALLTKSVSQAFPLLLPASLLVVRPGEFTRERVVRWLAAILIALAAGWAIYYVAFGASDASKLIAQFEQQYGKYTLPLSTLLTFPWPKWGANAASVVKWFGQLVTIPLSLATAAALLALPWLGRKAWLLGVWVVLPIVGQILIASIFYERYILFSIPPLFILIARLFDRMYERLAAWDIIARRALEWPAAGAASIAGLGLILLPAMVWDLGFLTDLQTANRIVDGFYGLRGMSDYVVEQAKTNPVYVVVNYSPAPVEDGAAVFLNNKPNVKVLRVAPLENKLTIFDPITQQTYPRQDLDGRDVYYVWGQGAETNSWLAGHVELVRSFPNLNRDGNAVGLYRVRFDDAFR